MQIISFKDLMSDTLFGHTLLVVVGGQDVCTAQSEIRVTRRVYNPVHFEG